MSCDFSWGLIKELNWVQGLSEGRSSLFLPSCLPVSQRWFPSRDTLPPCHPVGCCFCCSELSIKNQEKPSCSAGRWHCRSQLLRAASALLSACHKDPKGKTLCRVHWGHDALTSTAATEIQRKYAKGMRGNLTSNTSYIPRSSTQRSKLPGGVLDCILSWE